MQYATSALGRTTDVAEKIPKQRYENGIPNKKRKYTGVKIKNAMKHALWSNMITQ